MFNSTLERIYNHLHGAPVAIRPRAAPQRRIGICRSTASAVDEHQSASGSRAVGRRPDRNHRDRPAKAIAQAAAMTGYVLALTLTILVEGCVAAAVLRKFFWVETTLIQFTTWPVVAVLLPLVGHLLLIELGVGIAETFLWALVLPIGLRRAAAISFVANGVTTAIGLIFF
jgi:hypothetical protein